jgi:hypothetical protein
MVLFDQCLSMSTKSAARAMSSHVFIIDSGKRSAYVAIAAGSYCSAGDLCSRKTCLGGRSKRVNFDVRNMQIVAESILPGRLES